MRTIKFKPFRPTVDVDLWVLLSHKKLHELRLSTEPVPANAFYSTLPTRQLDNVAIAPNPSATRRLGRSRLTHESLSSPSDLRTDPFTICCGGEICITNTLEDFRTTDKIAFLRECGFSTGFLAEPEDFSSPPSWLLSPDSHLCRWRMLVYADLKKHEFFWSICWGTPVASRVSGTLSPVPDMDLVRDEYYRVVMEEQDRILAGEEPVAEVLGRFGRGFFCVDDDTKQVHGLRYLHDHAASETVSFGYVECLSCASSSDEGVFSWPLRNFLTALSLYYSRRQIAKTEISLYLLRHSSVPCERWTIQLPSISLSSSAPLKFVGWNKNVRKASVADLLDPIKLCEESVNLNLNLMKWRMLPELDLDLVSSTKALLVGSGTLGCHVARNLMAWGIFNITMMDRGLVSHSNPVRQPLFHFEDVGKDKATAAVDHLKRIYPSVNAKAFTIDIPMPGHPIPEDRVESVRDQVTLLEELIQEADVVFLLTDTRESRWLPAMLAMAHDVLVINAALGFESYLVMRHGLSNQDNQLGCYFCNDVVEPVDSTKDRTLDQQCTVTRPGGSAIAGALAVEMLVSLLHAQMGLTPAEGMTALGSIPHQIRGSLSTYQNLILQGSSYSQCIACSQKVIEAFREEGFEFIHRVCNQSGVLAELTGLRELQERTMRMLEESMMMMEEEEEDGEEDDDDDSDGFDLL